jgi:hypothetical protein
MVRCLLHGNNTHQWNGLRRIWIEILFQEQSYAVRFAGSLGPLGFLEGDSDNEFTVRGRQASLSPVRLPSWVLDGKLGDTKSHRIGI